MTSMRNISEANNPKGTSKRRLSILTDSVITDTQNRPQRNLDAFVPNASFDIRQLSLFRAEDDRALEDKIKFLNTFSKRILFFRYASLFNILRHYFELLRSELIFCNPHYFWWLVMLNRLGVFPVHGKQVSCQFTRHNSFTRRLPTLAKAPLEFRAFYTGGDQIALLERHGAPLGRIKFIEWRIDADWFRPADVSARSYILCPGNVHRDERLILKLAKATPMKIIRVGQIGILKEIYASHLGANLELQLNVDHLQFLRLLQGAAMVILPIEVCDEPAGITAALEAVSCCLPVLANDSFGVTPLLRSAYGMDPIPDLLPETWLTAIRSVLAGDLLDSSVLTRGRAHILQQRSILSEGADWNVLFG